MNSMSKRNRFREREITIIGYLLRIKSHNEDTLSILRYISMGHAIKHTIIDMISKLLCKDRINGLKSLPLVMRYKVLDILKKDSTWAVSFNDLFDIKE